MICIPWTDHVTLSLTQALTQKQRVFILCVIVSSQFVKLRDHGSLVIKVLHFIRLVNDYIPLVCLHNFSRGAVQWLTPASFQSWGRTIIPLGLGMKILPKYHCTKLASIYKGTIQEACGHFQFTPKLTTNNKPLRYYLESQGHAGMNKDLPGAASNLTVPPAGEPCEGRIHRSHQQKTKRDFLNHTTACMIAPIVPVP